jgi:hypothetical protein
MRCALPTVMRIACVFAVLVTTPVHGETNMITEQKSDGEILGWQSYHEGENIKTGDVWQLNADGVLVCKGLPKGYLYTDKSYTDVVMSLEWRWPPHGEPGNGGLLLRTTGKHQVWPKSLEVQLNHGAAGDYWGLVGYSLKGPQDRMKTLEHDVFGRLTNVKHTQSLEKPVGEWNRCDVTLQGRRVTVKINGVLVNEATDCEVEPGKIVLTAEGQEIHFRNVMLMEGK